MEQLRTKPRNNGTRKKKEYTYFAVESEVANEFKSISHAYRIQYSELMRRMLNNYRKEMERDRFYW
jgi:hypothetical protein